MKIHTLSFQLLISLALSEISWIHTIAWILTAREYHISSPSFYTPRAECRRNARRDFRSVAYCIAIPMQVCIQWTDSDVWSLLATRPECLFKKGDRQSEKKQWNGDRRVICNAKRGIDAGRRVIRHRGVSDGSDGAHPMWRSHSARTEMFFADEDWRLSRIDIYYWVCERWGFKGDYA